MKSVDWKTYRTRFLVKAKQLSSSLSFTDHLGRQHCGRKGDYLVESCDGVLSIAPRQIFEDIYVPMLAGDSSDVAPPNENAIAAQATASLAMNNLRMEPLQIESIKDDSNPRVEDPRRSDPNKSLRPARKSPQSVRSTPTRLGLM